MKIEVDLKKKYLLVAVGIILILGGIFAVSAVYPVFGHTASDIEGVCMSNSVGCSSVSVNYAKTAGSATTATTCTNCGSSSCTSCTTATNTIQWDGWARQSYLNQDVRIGSEPYFDSIYAMANHEGPYLKASGSYQGGSWGSVWVLAWNGLKVKNGANTGFTPVQASAFSVQSDIRAKKNIQSMIDNLDKVLALNPVRFDYKIEETSVNGRNIGLIAQEAEKIIPEIVLTDNDGIGMKSIDYSKLTPVLIGAIQEQQVQIEDLKTENLELKQTICKYYPKEAVCLN